MGYSMATIHVFWDEEAGVWIARCDEVCLVTEADSYDELIKKVSTMAPEMASENKVNITQYIIATEDRRLAIA